MLQLHACIHEQPDKWREWETVAGSDQDNIYRSSDLQDDPIWITPFDPYSQFGACAGARWIDGF
jgi:hypothetical protein